MFVGESVAVFEGDCVGSKVVVVVGAFVGNDDGDSDGVVHELVANGVTDKGVPEMYKYFAVVDTPPDAYNEIYPKLPFCKILYGDESVAVST